MYDCVVVSVLITVVLLPNVISECELGNFCMNADIF